MASGTYESQVVSDRVGGPLRTRRAVIRPAADAVVTLSGTTAVWAAHFELRNSRLWLTTWLFSFVDLRSDPRFADLVRDMGLKA